MRERTPLLFLALTAVVSAQDPLPTRARLEGEVVTPMLVPCANAEVELEFDGVVIARTRSDAEGMFVFPKAPPGFVVVRAFTDVPDVGAAVVDLLGETVGFVTLRVSPARVVRGVVRDETGQPVPGAWVGASPKGFGPFSIASCNTVADAHGAYRLAHVAFGPVRVRAWTPDASAFDGELDGTEDCTLDCVVDRSDANEVEFVLDGLPPNAQSLDLRVRAGQDNDQTPLPAALARPAQIEPGRWLVRGWVTADELCAHFVNPELAVYPHEALVQSGVGTTTRRFDAADPDARIRGIVRDAGGAPVAGLALAAQPLGPVHNGTRFVAVTDADGAFVVQAPAAPHEGFAIRAVSNTLALAGNDGNLAWFSQLHRADARWELTACASTTVRARLVDANRTPAAGVGIMLVATDGIERILGVGVSDRRGSVCIDGLSIGDRTRFRLECHGAPGVVESDFALAGGDNRDLGELRLEAPGSLLVCVKKANGTPAPGIAVYCTELDSTHNRHSLHAQVDRTGSLLWQGLDRGTYYATPMRASRSQAVPVLAGERSTATITLQE